MRRLVTVLALAFLVGHMPAHADPHAGMNMSAKGDAGPASRAFADALRRMHAAMDIAYSGNPDLDFAKGMEPHHRGAVDMARVELRYGKDPELRRLAASIVASQEKEIALMQRWIAAHAR